MSNIGNPMGRPSTVVAVVHCGWPDSTVATSVLVPPMSYVMTSSKPASFATCAAPMTPPAGPESTSRAAFAAASSAGNVPPAECMIRSDSTAGGSASARARRYPCTVGRSDALMAVVLARSYSRNSGSTSQLRLTVTPAAASRSPSRHSWTGLTKLNSRHTAAWRRPARFTSPTTRSISASVSASTTRPAASTRSRTPIQFASPVTGGGRSTRSA